jgi:metal-responsive CopG/Arc/MetJ family transcriptional regulator
MTIDEPLLSEVDKTIRELKTTRSAFIRSALYSVLRQYGIAKLERQHAEGYARHPVAVDEFELEESEHAWGEP